MKIAIIGGGASGLVCAITAAKISKEKNINNSVTVFESKDRVGKKILATGNGRCNMLNMDTNPFYFSSKGFHNYAISRFDASDNIRFFSEIGLYTRCDEEGRVYPLSNQATTVLDFLRKECIFQGVEIVTDCEIRTIRKTGRSFTLNDEYKFDETTKTIYKNYKSFIKSIAKLMASIPTMDLSPLAVNASGMHTSGFIFTGFIIACPVRPPVFIQTE